jgi:alpha-amylase/alpha-mannosidase (GH57 family)
MTEYSIKSKNDIHLQSTNGLININSALNIKDDLTIFSTSDNFIEKTIIINYSHSNEDLSTKTFFTLTNSNSDIIKIYNINITMLIKSSNDLYASCAIEGSVNFSGNNLNFNTIYKAALDTIDCNIKITYIQSQYSYP